MNNTQSQLPAERHILVHIKSTEKNYHFNRNEGLGGTLFYIFDFISFWSQNLNLCLIVCYAKWRNVKITSLWVFQGR